MAVYKYVDGVKYDTSTPEYKTAKAAFNERRRARLEQRDKDRVEAGWTKSGSQWVDQHGWNQRSPWSQEEHARIAKERNSGKAFSVDPLTRQLHGYDGVIRPDPKDPSTWVFPKGHTYSGPYKGPDGPSAGGKKKRGKSQGPSGAGRGRTNWLEKFIKELIAKNQGPTRQPPKPPTQLPPIQPPHGPSPSGPVGPSPVGSGDQVVVEGLPSRYQTGGTAGTPYQRPLYGGPSGFQAMYAQMQANPPDMGKYLRNPTGGGTGGGTGGTDVPPPGPTTDTPVPDPGDPTVIPPLPGQENLPPNTVDGPVNTTEPVDGLIPPGQQIHGQTVIDKLLGGELEEGSSFAAFLQAEGPALLAQAGPMTEREWRSWLLHRYWESSYAPTEPYAGGGGGPGTGPSGPGKAKF